MDPLGWIMGLALGAFIAVLLPMSGLATLLWLLIKRSTRRIGVVVAALAAVSVLVPAPWLPWDPALSLFDRAFLLMAYFFAAVLPWSLVVYLARKVRRMVGNGA